MWSAGRPDATAIKLIGSRGTMRVIVVAAVGRLKQGPETELSERYRKRAAGRPAARSVMREHRDHRNQGKPRRRCRQAHARRVDRARQCHSATRGGGAARRPRRKSRQRQPWPRQLAKWRAQRPAGGGLCDRRRRRQWPPACAPRPSCGLPSARPPGRINWCAIMLLEQLYRAATILGRPPLSPGLTAASIILNLVSLHCDAPKYTTSYSGPILAFPCVANICVLRLALT